MFIVYYSTNRRDPLIPCGIFESFVQAGKALCMLKLFPFKNKKKQKTKKKQCVINIVIDL